MYLIGLTGGIASGKSIVAQRLAEHGAVHIDADQLAREAVEPGTPALARIRKEFGEDFITPEGTLDRQALGALVFSDPEYRLKLNTIVHPEVRQRAEARIAAAEQSDPDAVIVYDIPLLVESQMTHSFDLVVVTHATRQTRINRLIRSRGMNRVEALDRLAAQVDDAERLAVADIVIDTNGALSETLKQADTLWHTIERTIRKEVPLRRSDVAEPSSAFPAPPQN